MLYDAFKERKKLMLRTQVGLQMINYRSLKDRQCKKKKQKKKSMNL